MELPTRSLVLRVCQFRHDRINSIYYNGIKNICQLILSIFSKVFYKNVKFLKTLKNLSLFQKKVRVLALAKTRT